MNEFQGLARTNPAVASGVLHTFQKKLWVPHEGGQAELMQSQARFRIVRAGRRWGKTEWAAHEALMAAILKPDQMVWWVANSDKNVRRGYRKVLSQLPTSLLARPAPSAKANDRVLEFKNGSMIEFYTAGTPDSLAGEGLNFLVVDEAALIDEMVWYQLLRPTLSDKDGRAIIISTPRGRNWFWKLWRRGQQPGKEYASWHFTSLDNPIISSEEVEDARRTLPKMLFEQEYMAEFLQNAASWFTIPDSQVTHDLVDPAGWVMLGIDLAKKEDFTVVSGCNAETRMPCVYDRWNEISWTTQLELLSDEIDRLEANPRVEGVTICVDSTGLGDVVYDNLDDLGYDVIPVNFGAGSQKELMAKQLSADIEQKRAWVFDSMLDEFESYEYNFTPSGRMQFEAADGHDDKVSAKMLENWGCVHEAPPGVKVHQGERPEPKALHHEDYTTPDAIRPDSVDDIMNRPEAWG